MVHSLLFFIALGASLSPALRCELVSELVSVCLEEDEDLRVDCRIKPKPSQINSYEFSWSSGPKETLINTNVSGSAADRRLTERSHVEPLEPYGYRLTLRDYARSLPYNTTFMCKISRVVASAYAERDHLQPCSAVSLVFKSCWTACALMVVGHLVGWRPH